jgi:ribosomal protein S18 acetylase RimI-like enzyme
MNPLDNPLWSSLCGTHAEFASGLSSLKVYPSDMAPFAAVPSGDVVLTDELLESALGDREFAYFVGTLPQFGTTRYERVAHDDILQMVRERVTPSPIRSDARVQPLDASHIDAMLELIGRVYPAYFRKRTIEMGQYAGIFDGTELVAMAGLRMAPQGYREISGVATDPRYAGRGYAGLLCDYLCDRIVEHGDQPMLHMDLDNVRARRLYESLGFIERRHVPMCGIKRR